MPLPRHTVPKTITRRWASAAVVEALGKVTLAKAFRGYDSPMLDSSERTAFSAVLRSRPQRGSPGVTVVQPPLSTDAVRKRAPGLPRSVLKLARVADHAGAVYDKGEPRAEPRGNVAHYLATFAMLTMLTMAPVSPADTLPTQRPGPGRTGRPVALDVRATLRVLVGLVNRRRPKRGAVTAAICVALMLWLEGHRRPHHRDSNRPLQLTTPRNRFALREVDGTYREKDILPLVEETEPWVVTGASIGRLAKAIQNLIGSKDGEYQDYVKPRRG